MSDQDLDRDALRFGGLLNLPEGSMIEDRSGDEWVCVDDGWSCLAEGALGPSDPESLYTTWSPLLLKRLGA